MTGRPRAARGARCLRSLVAGLCGLALLSSCTERRGLIDEVQPYALKKAHFVGEDLQDPTDNPEFYALATLVDVGGYGASQDGLFTSTYAQRLVRIKWQITETMLLGRLAYERIEGSDGKGVGRAVEDGTVVVAFRIESHFDILRARDPATGERLNIIEENTTGRPWYEREHMRVDWSKNLVTNAYDFDTLSLLGVRGGITYEPIAYFVSDPEDPNAPVFDLENGYFDITNKAFAKPETIDVSALGWGIKELPACLLPNDFMGGSYPAGSCNPVELTMRFSFRRVDEHQSDYEPAHRDGYRFRAAGAFTTERLGFARNYGMTDSLWHRLINRVNIWRRSHFYANPEDMTGPLECFTPATTPFGADPNRDLDENGTADECELVGGGSQCNTFKQRCTLPYRNREPLTQVWYVAEGSDLGYFEASKRAAHEWDVALRIAVRAAQYAECKSLGNEACDEDYPIFFGQMTDHQDMVQLAWEVDGCREGLTHVGWSCDEVAEIVAIERGLSQAHINIASMPEMIVLCHSPVEAGDPEACEGPRLPPGLTALDCQVAEARVDRDTMTLCRQAKRVRLGDIRHHVVNLIKEPQTPSPWGIWTGGTDPLTGEIVANCVNVWTHVTDRLSQEWVDVMRFVHGELSHWGITEAQWVREWASAVRAAAQGGVMPRMTKQEVESRVAGFTGLPEGQTGSLPDGLLEEVRELKQELREVKASLFADSAFRPTYSARREAAAGTWFEAQLMTPMMQQLHGAQGMPINDSTMDMISPLRGGNPSWERDLFNMRQTALGQRSACILHDDAARPSPVSMVSLGKLLQEKFGQFDPSDPWEVQHERAERMRSFFARRVHSGILAHEMGHALGLRHNFVSSSYAYAYRPQYWQLRTKNGAVTQACSDLSETGEDCVGPRWFDPVTQNEQDNLIWMWMHSSVMDFPGEVTQHLLGPGIYDFAALRMFYGNVASVLNPATPLDNMAKHMLMRLMDSFGGILGYDYEMSGQDVHYSQLNRRLNLIHDCQTVHDPQVFKPESWDEERDGTWSPLMDGHIVTVNGQYTRCQDQRVDYVGWERLRYPTTSQLGTSWYLGGPSLDPEGRLRVPYGFGTDAHADLGNMSVYRHDNGADPFEIFNFLITQQELNHIFDYYRGGRTTFSLRATVNRTLSRYSTKLRDGAKGLGFYKNIYERFGLEAGYNPDQLWPFIAKEVFADNVLAATMVFDHFSRTMARPQSGEHFYRRTDREPVLRSVDDAWASPGNIMVIIPDGASGYSGSISLGGKLLQTHLWSDSSEQNRLPIPLNVGQYYDKLYTSMLMTESVDNFAGSSLTDFLDARYRAVSLADLYPEGYRRWIANNLTGEARLKGARLAANAVGFPILDSSGYPGHPVGYITWWTRDPEVCFPSRGTLLCTIPQEGSTDPLVPDYTAVLDPQVGWEQQKFLIAWTLMYLPGNQKTKWLDMLRVWELGRDADPNLGQSRIELHDPLGRVYVARTFGKEEILGRTVQRGPAARVIEYANSLLVAAYEVTDGSDLDGDGVPDWYLPVYDPDTHQPIVKWDPVMAGLDENGQVIPEGLPGCNATDSSQCTCGANRACMELSLYLSVPAYLREAIDAYQLGSPEERGIR